jgi:hypothetical protein
MEQTRVCQWRDPSALASKNAMVKPFMAGSMRSEKIKKHCNGVDRLNQLRDVKMEIPVETDQFYMFRRMVNVWGSMLNI